MQTKTVTHDRPGEPLSVTVGEADVLMGMRHSVLISEAQALTWPDGSAEQDQPAQGEDTQPDQPAEGEANTLMGLEGDELAITLIRRYTWPNCKASAVASSGFDHATLTVEEFCKLPEIFAYNWEQAALELNPHWKLVKPETNEEEEQEKKDGDASISE